MSSEWHWYFDGCPCDACQRERYYRWLNELLAFALALFAQEAKA